MLKEQNDGLVTLADGSCNSNNMEEDGGRREYTYQTIPWKITIAVKYKNQK